MDARSRLLFTSLITISLSVAGEGIGIRINDDGVDHTHPEFQGKFDTGSSCSVWRPGSLTRKNGHGTAVASLSAGNAGNKVCGTGIAYDARISACRIINSDDPDDIATEILDSSVLYADMDDMHISQNSYGVPTCTVSGQRRGLQSAQCPFDDEDVCFDCRNVDWSDPEPNSNCEQSVATYCRSSTRSEDSLFACLDFLDLFTSCQYNSVSNAEQSAFQRGARQGRNGKGIVYVFASGNEHHAGADVNFEGVLTSRYTISVGAVGRDGKHASYSTGGASLMVVAPGGDADQYTNNLVANPGGGCYNMGPGTSFSAPIVSGAIALILQANNDLSWRDVHGILATSSKVVDTDHESWTTNAAGLHHSNVYGFGLLDVGAAVKAAESWSYYSEEQQIVEDSGSIDLVIPEYPNDGVETSIQIDGDIVVESVSVYLDLFHSSRGDLEIVLVSPSGTESVLHPSRRPENSADERWKLLTLRNWGESAEGSWTLRLVDHREGSLEDCVDNIWSIEADSIEIDCGTLERALVCEDGGEGSRFDAIFSGLSLNSAALVSADNVSPGDACCTCGGGRSADDAQNILRSWNIAVYGHVQSTPGSNPLPSPTGSQAQPPTRPNAASPTLVEPPVQSPIPDATSQGPAPILVRITESGGSRGSVALGLVSTVIMMMWSSY